MPRHAVASLLLVTLASCSHSAVTEKSAEASKHNGVVPADPKADSLPAADPVDDQDRLQAAMTALRNGSAPEFRGGVRPNGSMVSLVYSAEMRRVRAIGQDAIPALIEGLDDDAVCDQCIQILGGLDAIPAMPKLLSMLTPDDSRRDGLLLTALGAITKHPKSSGFHRFYFSPKIQQEAYQTFSAWYAEHSDSAVQVIKTPQLPQVEDPLPPQSDEEDVELAHLARTCFGDKFTRAIRVYMKSHGAKATIPFLIHAFGNSCSGCPARAEEILVEIGAPAVPALIAAAQQKKKGEHYLAKTIARFDEAILMPPLLEVLKDDKALRRDQVVELVIALEGRARDTVPVLRWILEADESASLELQWQAIRALCAIGPDAAEAGPAIIQYLKDQQSANEELPRRRRTPPPGRPTRDWIPRPFLPFGNDVVAGLGRLGPQADGILDYLIQEIDEPDDLGPFEAIALLGPSAERARPGLHTALTKVPSFARPAVYYALWKVGEPQEEIVRTVHENLVDAEADNRRSALETLRRLDAFKIEDLPTIIQALTDTDPDLRKEGLRALVALKAPAPGVVPKLVQLLDDPDPEFLQDVIQCLTEYGSEANSAIPRILELLLANTWPHSLAATFDVLKMGTPPAVAVPELILLLDQKSYWSQRTAAELLGRLGPAAEAALPRLRELVATPPRADNSNRSDDCRVDFAKVLLQIQNRSSDDQDLVATLLDDSEVRTRIGVASFLWKSPAHAERCIQELAQALSDDRVSIRELTAGSLAEIGPPAEAARPALNKALSDDESTVRMIAKSTLEAISSKPAK